MGRQATWTREEDAILLATAGTSTEQTNEQLVEAGYPPRTPAQIKYRRNYIGGSVPTRRGGGGDVSMAAARVESLRMELDELERRAAALRAQYDEAKADLIARLD